MTGLLGQPIDAGPGARLVGYDEFGRPVYQGILGTSVYGEGLAAQPSRPNQDGWDMVAAAQSGGYWQPDTREDWGTPGQALNQVIGLLAEGALNGITAPGRAAQGQPVTMGDVWDTALDWGVLSAPMTAPPGALRAGGLLDEYRGIHRAPGADAFEEGAAARLDDMTAVYPPDIYDNRVAARYYGHGGNHVPFDRESLDAIFAARGDPDAVVTVYRAVPGDVEGGLNPGDWVTLSRGYAESHGRGLIGDPRHDGGYRIIEQRVPARELFTDGNSINEFGWSPNGAGRGD